MRTHVFALVAVAILSVSGHALASNAVVQPSYDALLAMPTAERKAAFRRLEGGVQLAILQTHVDRWLEANRRRLSASQVALVKEVRDSLTSTRDVEASRRLHEGMQCELWRSDVAALEFPDDQLVAPSWFGDVDHWFRECVWSKAINVVF